MCDFVLMLLFVAVKSHKQVHIIVQDMECLFLRVVFHTNRDSQLEHTNFYNIKFNTNGISRFQELFVILI